MASYYAAIFTDLERHSEAWTRIPRDRMVAIIAEYRYLAESMAARYGSHHFNFTGDGHLFLYESADAAVQFGLKLIDRWTSNGGGSAAAGQSPPRIPLRLGCHFGECTPLEGSDAWVGRAINLAKGVEGAAEPNSLLVTENVLELVDLPMYRFEAAGSHELKGDHLPQRVLYTMTALDESALDLKPGQELTAEAWFLKAVGLIGTSRENSRQEADCYGAALRLRPDYPEAHGNLAILLRATGDHGGAAKHYRQALRLRPDYPEAHYNYALQLEAQERLEPAEEHYDAALRLWPDFPEAHNNLAILLQGRGDLAAAEPHYREALRLRPDDPETHYNYALLLQARGDTAAAEDHFRTAYELAPEVPTFRTAIEPPG